MFRLAFIVLSLSLSVSCLAHAQQADPNQLENLKSQQANAQKQAKDLEKEQNKIRLQVDKLQTALVQASGRARGYERAGNRAREKLLVLSKREAGLKQKLFADRLALADFLAALQRIQTQPPPALLLHADSAQKAGTAANMMGYLALELAKKTKILETQLTDLQNLRAEMDKKRNEIAHNSAEVRAQIARIKSKIAAKSKLSHNLDKDRKRKTEQAARLAKQAKTLQDLIARFEENAEDIVPRIKPKPGQREILPRLKPKPGQGPAPVRIMQGASRFADARGQVPLPVFGTLVRAYGARLPSGGRAKGIRLRTQSRAQVIAPFAGRIEFSGAFNDDHVIIINVGNGYFIVLTGLGETFESAGAYVKAGAPIGLMPGDGINGQKAELFMEFRKNKTSINPKPWIGPALAHAR